MEELRKWRLDQEDLMVSFDVKSLFTNVPIDDVLIILMERLQGDEILSDRTIVDPSCTVEWGIFGPGGCLWPAFGKVFVLIKNPSHRSHQDHPIHE